MPVRFIGNDQIREGLAKTVTRFPIVLDEATANPSNDPANV